MRGAIAPGLPECQGYDQKHPDDAGTGHQAPALDRLATLPLRFLTLRALLLARMLCLLFGLLGLATGAFSFLGFHALLERDHLLAVFFGLCVQFGDDPGALSLLGFCFLCLTSGLQHFGSFRWGFGFT